LTYVCTYICMYSYAHICMYTYAHMYVYICTYVCIHMHICMYTYAHMYAYICTYVCIHMHICMYIFRTRIRRRSTYIGHISKGCDILMVTIWKFTFWHVAIWPSSYPTRPFWRMYVELHRISRRSTYVGHISKWCDVSMVTIWKLTFKGK
jgi:hypothetical protein